jgi:hypothetical protein
MTPFEPNLTAWFRLVTMSRTCLKAQEADGSV